MKQKPLIFLSFTLATLFFTLSPLFGEGKFLRPFLGYAYSVHLFAFTLWSITAILLLIKYRRIELRKPPTSLVICFIWLFFVLIYPLFGVKSEVYYRTYLIVCLLVLLAIFLLLRQDVLSRTYLFVPIALIGLYETGVVLLQFAQIIPSNSTSFSTTGTGINPNLAAMTICMTIPACLGLIERGGLPTIGSRRLRRWGGVVVAFMVVAVVITQCRSAVLALLVISLVYLVRFFGTLKLDKRKVLLLAIPILLIVVFVTANRHKQASANGRLTIWKLSTELLMEKPLSGYGYGFFEKAYNLHQAEYFSNIRPEEERMNATYTAMAYNEYLEQSVMGGVVGGGLFTAFLLALMWNGWKHRKLNPACLAGVLAFATMSLFNFTVAYPVVFLVLLFYAAAIMDASLSPVGNSSIQPKSNTLTNYALPSVAALSIVFVLFSLKKYDAQRQLALADNLLKKGQQEQAGRILHQIEPAISTSEAFYQTKAHYQYSKGDLPAVRQSMLQVLTLTSNPIVMEELALITARLGNSQEAENFLLLACNMEPHLFKPRVLLMQFYWGTGQRKKAHAVAKNIIRLKPKFNSKQVADFKAMAQFVLNKATNFNESKP